MRHMVIHYFYSSPTTAFEDTVLDAQERRRPSLSAPLISYRISYRVGHFRPGPTETDITVAYNLDLDDKYQ